MESGIFMEYFEVFNADGTPTGRIEERGVVHAQGLWHRTVHVWIHRYGEALLFQKRGILKDSHPGLWDVSAAGHIDVGERPEQTARREVKEELGLTVRIDDLHFIDNTSRTLISRKGAFIDNEITYVYLYEFSGEASDLSPDPAEVDAIRFIEINDLRNMLKDTGERSIFVPYDHGYYEHIISLVEQRTRIK
jgi:isopentenyl-diphosphate delta-isomerase